MLHVLHEYLVHQRLVRNYVVNGQLAPAGKLGWGLADDPDRGRGAAGFQIHDDVRNKGRDDIAISRGKFAQRRQHLRFQIFYFELDIEESAFAVTLNYVRQPGQSRQLLGSSLRDSELAGLRVVANHGGPASRQADVEFKTVAAMLERKIERGESILWDSGRGTCPAMAEEEEGKAGHYALYFVNRFKGCELRGKNQLVEIEIADRFSRIRRFFGLLDRLLELLLEKAGRILLGFH